MHATVVVVSTVSGAISDVEEPRTPRKVAGQALGRADEREAQVTSTTNLHAFAQCLSLPSA